MDKCPLYHVHTLTSQSNEIRSDRQSAPVSVVNIPWCGHKHSPAEKHIVTKVMGGGNILRCAGKLVDCQVPRDKLGDVNTSVE